VPANVRFIYVSGQFPGQLVGWLMNSTVIGRALACMAYVKATLEAAGSSMDQVLNVGIFVGDITMLTEVNAFFDEIFRTTSARSTVGYASLPLGVEIKIDCLAWVKVNSEDAALSNI
jgi:2-iminobutanoate/2-iminopropanoate deaminase